jgi:serine/threonine protein kinase
MQWQSDFSSGGEPCCFQEAEPPMTNRRIDMRKIRDVLTNHFDRRFSNRKSATIVGLNHTTVAEYLDRFTKAGLTWPLPAEMDDATLENLLFSKPNTAVPAEAVATLIDFSKVHEDLKRQGATLTSWHNEWKGTVPPEQSIGYAHFCRAYQVYKNSLRLSMRRTEVYGENTYVDYSGLLIDITEPSTGVIRSAQIFIGVLGGSNYTYCEATVTDPFGVESSYHRVEYRKCEFKAMLNGRLYFKMCPPEAFTEQPHGPAFDVYQLGLTLYRMCTGNDEFYRQFATYGTTPSTFDRNRFKVAVRNGQFPDRDKFPEHIPSRLRSVIKACLESDVGQRTASALNVANGLAQVDEKLDWSYSVTPASRAWSRRSDTMEYRIEVKSDGSSYAQKGSIGGKLSRITEYCKPSINSSSIKKFLKEI